MQTIQSLLSNPQYPYKKVLEKLIAHRLNKDTPRVLAHLDDEMFATDIQWIQTSYNQYAIHKEPLEYILGYVEFLGYRFAVNRHTLIPRPETEYMIQAVVAELNSKQTPHILIDVGTGCGVLGISSLLHAGQYLDQVYLTDYYEQTLEQAQTNLKQYQDIASKNPTLSGPVRNHVQTFHCSLLDHPVLTSVISDQQSIIIVANLPYIPEQLFEHNVEDNVKLREPKAAFVWGEDGLDRYRQMLDQIISIRNPQSANPLIMFLEMMTRQVEILTSAYKNHFLFEEVATFHMNIRIVKATSLS
jgi:release factor glutamine methyltransferase